MITSKILRIYADYNKRLGAYKITYILQRDHGIHISIGRVYRLMKSLQLPRMSTEKPFRHHKRNENGQCTNHLQQDFNQKAPNLVWGSDFTYIKAAVLSTFLLIVSTLLTIVQFWKLSFNTSHLLIIALLLLFLHIFIQTAYKGVHPYER